MKTSRSLLWRKQSWSNCSLVQVKQRIHVELVYSWLPATQRIEESLSDHFSCCPAGSDGIKTYVIQKCQYFWENNSQGKAVSHCFPPCLGWWWMSLGVSQVQNPSLQSYVGREFLLLPDSWKSRRQQRLLRLTLLLEGSWGVWTCWVSNAEAELWESTSEQLQGV